MTQAATAKPSAFTIAPHKAHKNILVITPDASLKNLLEDSQADAFLKQLEQALAQKPANEKRTFILDLSNIEHVNSTHIGSWLQAHKKTHAQGESFIIAAPAPGIYEALMITRLNRLISIGTTMDAAVAQAQNQR